MLACLPLQIAKMNELTFPLFNRDPIVRSRIDLWDQNKLFDFISGNQPYCPFKFQKKIVFDNPIIQPWPDWMKQNWSPGHKSIFFSGGVLYQPVCPFKLQTNECFNFPVIQPWPAWAKQNLSLGHKSIFFDNQLVFPNLTSKIHV